MKVCLHTYSSDYLLSFRAWNTRVNNHIATQRRKFSHFNIKLILNPLLHDWEHKSRAACVGNTTGYEQDILSEYKKLDYQRENSGYSSEPNFPDSCVSFTAASPLHHILPNSEILNCHFYLAAGNLHHMLAMLIILYLYRSPLKCVKNNLLKLKCQN